MADYEVYLTDDAESDLEEITDYIERHDSAERADHIYEQIKKIILKLELLPGRGRVVPELKDKGVTEYREILSKTLPHPVFRGRQERLRSLHFRWQKGCRGHTEPPTITLTFALAAPALTQ